MADKKNNDEVAGDESGTLKHASQQARERAIAKMRETQEKMEQEGTDKGAAAGKETEKKTAQSGSMSDFVGEAEGSDKLVLEADGSQEKMIDESTGQQLLRQVKVYSPFKVYFDNDAFSISATNGTGPFDILPGHKNFLSLLLPGELNIRARAGDEKLKIERGIMHVHGDIVRVFLDV